MAIHSYKLVTNLSVIYLCLSILSSYISPKKKLHKEMKQNSSFLKPFFLYFFQMKEMTILSYK